MEKFGIDISHWQGDFNMAQAKAEGVEFAIIKAGGADDGLYKDSKFESNYNKAVSCGMDKGAYFFGCAFSVADAVKEAQYFIGLLNGKRFEYPVFYDVEGKMLNQDRGLLTGIVIAFCEELENNGYYVGIYTSESHYNSSLDDSRLAPYTHWTAKYSKNSPSLSSGNATAMWQYGGEKNFIRSNQIAGTTCDQDYCYVDYPSAIINGGMNGYGTEPAAPEQPQPTPEQPAPTTAHSVGEVVSYGTIYASSDSDKGLKPAYNSGEITKIVPGARNPYLIGNGTGWINDGCISESAGTPVPEPASIGVGTIVRVANAVNYNGVKVKAWFNDEGYEVTELSGDRAVLKHNGDLFDAFHVSDLEVM